MGYSNMKYSTSDLSKILSLSGNTIRRYEKMGYLGNNRNGCNGYREFDSKDVEKLMYVSKYRKLDLSHKDISDIFENDINFTQKVFTNKLSEFENKLNYMVALMHMLKDDINLIGRIQEYGNKPFFFDCSAMSYVFYQIDGKLCTKETGEDVESFINTCNEYEYMYYFNREHIVNGELKYSEGIVANQLMADKYKVKITDNIHFYKKRECALQFIKLPLDFWDDKTYAKEHIKELLFNDALKFIEENGRYLDGDVIGIKLGISKENGEEYQYVLMHFPCSQK